MASRKFFSLTILATALLIGAGPAPAEPLGRLFFTPERRAALERQRQLNIQEAQTLEGASLSLDGVVVRSGGKNTIWVNQVPQSEYSPATGVSARLAPKEPGRAVVTAGEEVPATLKVGEAINRATRETKDVVGDGRIEVRHAGYAGNRK